VTKSRNLNSFPVCSTGLRHGRLCCCCTPGRNLHSRSFASSFIPAAGFAALEGVARTGVPRLGSLGKIAHGAPHPIAPAAQAVYPGPPHGGDRVALPGVGPPSHFLLPSADRKQATQARRTRGPFPISRCQASSQSFQDWNFQRCAQGLGDLGSPGLSGARSPDCSRSVPTAYQQPSIGAYSLDLRLRLFFRSLPLPML
jgi:hypothetical protein